MKPDQNPKVVAAGAVEAGTAAVDGAEGARTKPSVRARGIPVCTYHGLSNKK